MEVFKAAVEKLFVKWDQISDDIFARTLNYVVEVLDKIENIFIYERGELWKAVEPPIFEAIKYVNSMIYHTVSDFVGKLTSQI